MKFTMDGTGKRGVITVEGGLTVRNIEEAKSLLLSSLQQADTLRLDLDGLTEVDLCGLQLSCSFNQTALQLDKVVEYPESVPPAFARAVEEAGACFHSGCKLAGERCFWKRGIA